VKAGNTCRIFIRKPDGSRVLYRHKKWILEKQDVMNDNSDDSNAFKFVEKIKENWEICTRIK
jgi:hypothetical protein